MLDNTNYEGKKKAGDLSQAVGVVIGVVIAVAVAIFIFFVGLPHSESVLETNGEFSVSEESLIRELTTTQNATTSTTTRAVELNVATSS
ncbi:MAG: hypothetical protein WDZ73_01180 [Candidatus Paceibacterota bacterium]